MRINRVAAVLITALMVIHTAAAVPDAVEGLSALVTETGAEQTVKFRFPIAADDPGTYTYNATIDATGPVIFSDVETTFGGVRAGGFITFEVTFAGATASYDTFINAYDGVDNGTVSCTVTVDTANLYEYDACGAMDPTYQDYYCLNTVDENFGFAVAQGIDLTTSGDILRLTVDGDNSAYGGLNLGGDSVEYRYDFTIASQADGSVSKILFFFSDVDLEASASAVGDAGATIKSSFTVPRTGAFATGVGVAFEESGSDYNVKLFYNDDGTTFLLTEEVWTDGVGANTNTDGTLKFSEYLGLFEVTLGNEVARFSTDEITNFAAFQTFWVVEYGGTSLFATRSFHVTDGVSNCILTLDPTLGGGVAEPGAPSAIEAFEDFTGRGGAIGNPTFPFIDMNTTAANMEITEEALGYLMAGTSLFILTIVGFVAGRKTGIIVGVLLTLPFVYLLGNIPGWLIVLIFLGSMAAGIMKKGKTNQAVFEGA